jgi:hypothetical protein
VTCALEGNATDPLPVAGTDDDLAGVRKTLEDALSAELAPWAERHPHSGGWDLRLELFRAEARDTTVSLSVRATLSSVAQTRRECRETADTAAAAFSACVQTLAHDLNHWIEGAQP